MATEDLPSAALFPVFREIENLHKRLHACGTEILQLSGEGKDSEAVARLNELHSLRDKFLGELKLLLNRELD